MAEAFQHLEQAFVWSENVTAIPTHIRPQIEHLVQKCRLIKGELERVR